MNLSLSQAAYLISELSAHPITRHGVWFQGELGKIAIKWDAGRKVVEKEEAVRFAQTWHGGKSGPKPRVKPPL